MHTRIFPDGSSLVRPAELAWAPWLADGSEFRVLDVDRDFNKATVLIRSVGGAKLQGQLRHQGVAEYFVEHGELRFVDGRLAAHDYLVAPGGTAFDALSFRPGSQVYAIIHGGLRLDHIAGAQFIDVDWWVNRACRQDASNHLD